MIEPTRMEDLDDPAFVQHAKDLMGGGAIKPDEEDFDRTVECKTDEEAAVGYKAAQVRKLMRIWGEWKAMQNTLRTP
jgi:hypothetical protein